MDDLLIRALVAVPVVVFVPVALGAPERQAARAALVGLLLAAAFAPHFREWQMWLLVALPVFASSFCRPPDVWWPSLLGTIVTVGVAVAVTKPSTARDAVFD